MVKLFGEEIQVKAEILRIDSFSSHADEHHLLAWVEKVDPNVMAFINHGEDKVAESFAMEVATAIQKPAVAPYSGEVWDLATGELAYKAEVKPVIKKETHSKSEGEDHRTSSNMSAEYKNLRSSADSLMKLVGRSGEVSNKELKKMQADIEELIKKYQ